MKQWAKNCLITAIAIVFGVALFSLAWNAKREDAHTAFAETNPAVKIPNNALSVVEALQTVFRSVSDAILPSVVELNVVETKTRQVNPMGGFPFFFFGQEDPDAKTEEYKQEGLGSGVIVRRRGNTLYVLTNNHVVGSATEISVKLYNGKSYTGKLVGTDERKDIALVSFESDDKAIPVAALGDSDTVHAGDICFAMGTPLGYYSSVTQGIISATGRSGGNIGNISDFIQTDAAINQGNSGGPLINIYGEVIGVNTWIASQSGGSQGLGFAIPINNVKKAIDDLIAGGKVTYGWLGVSLIDVDDDYKEALGVKGTDGALAVNVFIGSPAAKAGIQPGDYITALNGKSIKTYDQLTRSIGDLPVGQTATFSIIRNGKKIEAKAKIEKRENEQAVSNAKLWPGFMAYPLTDELRKQLKLENKVSGVLVYTVEAKSSAAVLRIQRGDVITAVNDKPVKNLKEFYAALDSSGKKEMWFDIHRDGHTITTVKYKL